MRRRLTVGRIGRVALAFLVAQLSLGQLVCRYPAVFSHLRRTLAGIDDRLLHAAVRRLEKCGAIVREGKTFRVTTFGFRTALTRSLGIEKVPIPKDWGELWVVAAFDVPDSSVPERRMLRECLLALGFGKVQKSVYAHPNPAAAPRLASIAATLGAERRLVLIRGAEIDGDVALRRKFKL